MNRYQIVMISDYGKVVITGSDDMSSTISVMFEIYAKMRPSLVWGTHWLEIQDVFENIIIAKSPTIFVPSVGMAESEYDPRIEIVYKKRYGSHTELTRFDTVTLERRLPYYIISFVK